jgi:hypothetical protein
VKGFCPKDKGNSYYISLGSPVKQRNQVTCAQYTLLSGPFVIELLMGNSRPAKDALKQLYNVVKVKNNQNILAASLNN